MKKPAFSRFDVLLLVLVVLEWYVLFYSKRYLPQTANATLFFLISVVIGVVVIMKFLDTPVSIAKTENVKSRRLWPLLACLPLLLFIPFLSRVFADIPIDPANSDVVPIINAAVARVLNGEHPYQTVHMPTYDLPLNYLPMQWLPYTVPELLKIDYRWMAFAIWALGCVVVITRLQRTATAWPMKLTVPLMLLLGMVIILVEDKFLLGFSVETMIIGYYMLFISSINQRSALFQGAMIAICLLSRYSLVLWLPLWAFVLLVSANRKNLFQTVGVTALIVLAIYVIPFLSKDWSYFFDGYKYYDRAAIGEWTTNVNPDTGKPYHLYAGTGFANLFYEQLSHWEIADRIKRLQKVHLLVSILVPLVMGVWYYFNRARIHARVFLMASFKIYLAFFLGFIQVPYMYLMLVPAFLSITIFAEQLRYKPATS